MLAQIFRRRVPCRFRDLVIACVIAVSVSSCASEPTNLRDLAPAESLVYLESNDLEAALRPIVESTAFAQAAKSKPDLSPLRGVQIAIAVTGFETTEAKVTEEASVLSFKPNFVAIAETHLWNWQAKSFAENQLGEFINKVYGGGVQLESGSKNGGTDYIWTAEDGRKAYAFVSGSVVYFGNDTSSIEKCLAVRRREADPFSKTGKATSATPSLAIGYISPEGIAQIANIVGAAQAKESGDDEQLQSFVARVLPQLLRGSISEASWSAVASEQGIEDKLTFSTTADITSVFGETMTPSEAGDPSLFEFIPPNTPSVTRYNLRDPQVAWRSLLLTAQKLTDPTSGQILAQFSGAFFEPYAVRDAEMFLSAVGNNIVTAKFDETGEQPVVVVSVVDGEKIRRSLLPDLKPDKQKTSEFGSEIWTSPDGIAAAFVDNKFVAGDAESVFKSLAARRGGESLVKTSSARPLANTRATATTIALDPHIGAEVAQVLSEIKADDANSVIRYLTETRFTKSGVERRVVSDFGLLGSIIAELAPGE